MIARLRSGELPVDQVPDAVADLRAGLTLGRTRTTSWPACPTRTCGGGRRRVRAHGDGGPPPERGRGHAGGPGRHALPGAARPQPKEVGRLLRLFLSARLDVRFRPEHQYLVALNERGLLIGGIFYEVEEGGRAAHLEKIVVAERYRKKGVADGLMHEFLNRLGSAGVRNVTTGFFRPEYFYGYGSASRSDSPGWSRIFPSPVRLRPRTRNRRSRTGVPYELRSRRTRVRVT